MLISVIVGSSRENSQSEKVAKYVQTLLSCDTSLHSVRDLFPKFWDHEAFEDKKASEVLQNQAVLQDFAAADGFIVVVPEWNGMAPPALKNLFIVCNKELAHKPALIVSVSAGMGGSYPIVELRMSSYKNSRICYLPDHAIVRHAEQMLNEAEPQNSDDTRIREKLVYLVKMLEVYAIAFQSIRASGVADFVTHPNGM